MEKEKEKEHYGPIEISMRPAPGWYYGKFFKYATAILLTLIILFFAYQVSFFVTPILNFVSILFTPIIISFLFYYLLRPLVYALENWHIPRGVSILFIYVAIAILLTIFFAYLGPVLAQQIKAIANTSVETLEILKERSKDLAIYTFNLNLEYQLQQRFFTFLQGITQILSQNILDVLGLITRIATILIVIPFIVFYLLKDDRHFASVFLNPFPEDFGKEVRKILRNIDSTLSTYINGLVLVSFCIGALLFVGYLIIGLDYALILSIIAFIFMSIPFLGPFIAITPALLVGMSDSTWMTIKVLIVFLIVQQLESNIISPQIIGQRLHIHPLTIILLLLAAGSLYGLLGLLLATPAYAVTKILIENLYKIYRLRYPR